ncbi:myc box-dependent-interacting protein 1-like isoform X2 [Tubulanus polymorphus]|uniref:myc box-dependent-interacting protein 1-like isoform X2 n=1 Tax=Tubulanus polymorphus TaxID=672921 RepID=UPI003DA5388F
MAESKGGIFAKTLQKQFVRTKHKVLQNLGKAEKTKDDHFDIYTNNFHHQQSQATRLTKELKNYIQCVKAVSIASKSLSEVIEEVYEPDWTEHAEVRELVESQDLLWADYVNKLTEQVLGPLSVYMAQFPDMKTKIAKRSRKLVDYDNSKHHLEHVKSAKKKDDAKISKAADELKDSKDIFEQLNDELHQELPSLYDSRVQVYSSTLLQLYSSGATFNSEIGKVELQLSDTMQELEREFNAGEFRTSPSHSQLNDSEKRSSIASSEGGSSHTHSPVLIKASPKHNSIINEETKKSENKSEAKRLHKQSAKGFPKYSELLKKEDVENHTTEETAVEEESRYEPIEVTNSPVKKVEPPKVDGYDNVSMPGPPRPDDAPPKPPPPSTPTSAKAPAKVEDDNEEDEKEKSVYVVDEDSSAVYQVPTSNEPTEDLPEGALYKVIATHPYAAVDPDELNLEKGDIVIVIKFENEEEQDDGWQMGIIESTGRKGVFPENFTKKI